MTLFMPGLLVSGRYRLGTELGRGGAATVFSALDETLDREVAVKVWSADGSHPTDPPAESRLTARLTHAGVVGVYDAGEHDGQPYLVMEKLNSGSLADQLRQGRLDLDRTLSIGGQVARALAYVHMRGFVHGDVKPANVLFANTERCKLTDFGVASAADGKRVGDPLGTPRYASPEQLRGKSATAASDVYALGLVLIECLTGGATEQRPPVVPERAPSDVQDLLRAMTADDPVRRPDAAEVARRLDAPHPVEPAHTTVLAPLPTQRMPAPSRHKPLLLTGAILLVFVALALTGARPDRPSSTPRPTTTPTPTLHMTSPAAARVGTQVAPVRQAGRPAKGHGPGHGHHHK